MEYRDQLASLITQEDAREYDREYKRGHANIHRLPIMLAAMDEMMLDIAKGASRERAFADYFTPTASNHRIARKLGLALDVRRGQWVRTDIKVSA